LTTNCRATVPFTLADMKQQSRRHDSLKQPTHASNRAGAVATMDSMSLHHVGLNLASVPS